MARIYDDVGSDRHGQLVIEPLSDDCSIAFYVPSKPVLARFGQPTDQPANYRKRLIEFRGRENSITIYPLNVTRKENGFLECKYQKIQRLTLRHGKLALFHQDQTETSEEKYFVSTSFGPTKPIDIDDTTIESLRTIPSTQFEVMRILESLPSAFIKDFDYGLGFMASHQFIVDAVENLSDCEEIVISSDAPTHIDTNQGIFYISDRDFEDIEHQLRKINATARAWQRSVKRLDVHNFLAQRTSNAKVSIEIPRSSLRKILATAIEGSDNLLPREQFKTVLSLVSRNTKVILDLDPEKLRNLQDQIEIAKLEKLASEYQKLMAQKKSEWDWQMLLNRYSFVFNLVLGHPVVKIRGQASVGGHTVSGRGRKIADFLVKNRMTNNLAIVEIKRPDTKVLNSRPIRDDIYSASAALSGAISQVLDQKYRLQKEIATIKDNSGIFDIESYSIHCSLIIGRIPVEVSERKSFEIFRGNSKDVHIVTFDELYEKIVMLRDFLDPPEDELRASPRKNELPF